MARRVTYRVQFQVRDLPGLLDMLRYDRALVRTWDHDRGDSTRPESFTVTLEADREPTFDRWSSFRLFPKDVQEVTV